jgi:hypothetical protein
MNCEHHSVKRRFDNELICTACSPESAGKNRAGITNKPIKSMLPAFSPPELFTAFSSPDPGGEKVCVFQFPKTTSSTDALRTKQAALGERPVQFYWKVASGCLGGGGFLHPGGGVFALEVALPAFSIFNFVILSAHKCLYFVRTLRFCGAHYESFGPAIQHLFDAGRPVGTGRRL